MAVHNTVGINGEKEAVSYLIKKNYKILETNWRYKKKEVDIIASIDNEIVIAEVKTRSNDYFEDPKEAVTIRKQRFIIEAANEYIIEKNIDLEVRFDIISIIANEKFHKIEHIENAFYPLLR